MNNILCVISGGQDSITCLFWALREARISGGRVFAIGFIYGQNHANELTYAKAICDRENVDFKLMDITPIFTELNQSALISGGDVTAILPSGMPASFVPNRNQTFLTLAHSYAQRIGATRIVTGVCQTDYSGYHDCRKEFIKNLEKVTNLGSVGYSVSPEFIAGFIEGEGCFSRGNYKKANGEKVNYPTFSLEQTDFGILSELKSFFGVGSIRERKNASNNLKSWEYKVSYSECVYIKNLIINFGSVGGRQHKKFQSWCLEHKSYLEREDKGFYRKVGNVDNRVIIETPLMYLTKAETFKLAKKLNCLDIIVNETMTCYYGNTTHHYWGMGCGECPSCKLRQNGFDEFIKIENNEQKGN